MRLGVKVILILVVLGVLAAGLLPPLFFEGTLRGYANTAAQKGATAFLDGSSTVEVKRIVATSIAAHHGVHLVSIKTNGTTLIGTTVTVVVRQNIHTFMSGFPGLEGWFRLTVSESASQIP